jgi:hypothetical protein
VPFLDYLPKVTNRILLLDPRYIRLNMTEKTTIVIALGIAWLFWFLFFLYLGV